MAKYSDYVKKSNENDQLELEIDDAQQQAADRQDGSGGDEGFKLPERFKDKSAEDVAKAYAELERLNSRQAQDLGRMRKLADELLEIRSTTSGNQSDATNQAKEPPKPVTVDDLYEDVEGTIRKVAETASKDKVDKLEQAFETVTRREMEREFSGKHPDYKDVIQNPEFQNWVTESNYRLRLLQQADSYDFEAADDLFTMYKDSTKRAVDAEKAEKDKERKRKVRGAELESGSAGVANIPNTFSRHELLDKRLRSKRGDMEAARWLATNVDAIRTAYSEGRVTD